MRRASPGKSGRREGLSGGRLSNCAPCRCPAEPLVPVDRIGVGLRPRLCEKSKTTSHKFDNERFESRKSRDSAPTGPKMHRIILSPIVFTQARPNAEVHVARKRPLAHDHVRIHLCFAIESSILSWQLIVGLRARPRARRRIERPARGAMGSPCAAVHNLTLLGKLSLNEWGHLSQTDAKFTIQRPRKSPWSAFEHLVASSQGFESRRS
jgi:hypothetical protein